MGWDGTLWGIDANGAPHGYNQTAAQWDAHGTGVDAVAMLVQDLFVFYGNSYVVVDFSSRKTQGDPIEIGKTWPQLPASFQIGVTGAAVVGGYLTLFRGGRYVSVDAPTVVRQISQLTDWGTYPGWEGGAFDAVMDAGTGGVLLFRTVSGAAQVRRVDLVAGRAEFPVSLASFQDLASHLPPTWDVTGIDAGVQFGSKLLVYKGPALVFADEADVGPAPSSYVGGMFSSWPAAWHPTLAHAPGGRVNNLWAAMRDGKGVVRHDGTQWLAMSGTATYAAVGRDDTVLTIGLGADSIWRLNAADGWDLLGSGLGQLVQIALGDASTMWACDNAGQVSTFTDGSLCPNEEIGTAVHVAANYDGTLWHAKGDAKVYRFGAANEGFVIPQETPAVATKIASTGFGNAYSLMAAPNGSSTIYCYNSPYVFKSPEQYRNVTSAIEHGLGMLFFVDMAPVEFGVVQSYLNAVDAHTGLQIWRSTLSPVNVDLTSPTYDPQRELVYVGSVSDAGPDSAGEGSLIAVNARTGLVEWVTSTAADRVTHVAGIDAPPTLSGSKICIGDRNGCLHAFDAAVMRLERGGPATWTNAIASKGILSRSSAALVVNGQVYCSVWQNNSSITVLSCALKTGQGDIARALYTSITDPELVPLGAPVFGRTAPAGLPYLYVQGLTEIHGIDLSVPGADIPSSDVGFTPGPGVRFTSGMARQDGVLWVGSDTGVLYGFDSAMVPVPYTPFSSDQFGPLNSTPVPYQSSDGTKAIFLLNAGTYLGVFSPATGIFATVPLGATMAESISRGVVDGVVYVSGTSGMVSKPQAQLFGICVDGLTSALRDFIVESELMQDYDEPTPGTGVAVARYQTHLTIVDDLKTPRPHTAVKIWADTPGTVIIVDGATYTVGPQDDEFAAAQTGHDGSMEIVSNATNLHTSPLRIWAGFMDPYERILVQPDREFQSRIMTAHDDATNDDPDKVNLATTANYAGTALFSAAQSQQGLPAQAATMIQQMGGSVGLGGDPKLAASGGPSRLSTGMPKSYIPYADLPGMTYSPTNAPVTRMVTVGVPLGINMAINSTGKHVYANLAPADAASAIDGMSGVPWTPKSLGDAACARRVGSWWSDIWNDIQQIATEVTHFVVSVAEDIYIGIQFVVNDITQVFKAILSTISDAIGAVGAFFKKLGATIMNVVEAFGVLLQFDEIMKTHIAIRNEINSRGSLLGASITTNVIPELDRFFMAGEEAIKSLFDKLKAQVDNQAISQLKGQGSTEHTTYTVSPADGSKPRSHAVKCSWGTRKMKTGVTSASTPAVSTVFDPPAMPVALSDFINTFSSRITDDPILSGQISQIKTDFSNLFSPSSLSNFIAEGVSILIDALEVLLIGALAVSNAFLNGLLKVLGDVIADLFAPDGILNAPLNVPILSWLYKDLTGETLTFLNIATLVAAIPVTVLYQSATGRRPSQDLAADKILAGSPHPGGVGADSIIQTIMGIFGALLSIPSGIVSGLIDLLGTESAPPLMARIALTFSILTSTTSFPASIKNDGPLDWAGWGAVLGAQATNVFGIFSIPAPLSDVLTYLLPLVYAMCNIASMSIFIDQMAQSKGGFANQFGIGLSIASTVAGILNPLKLISSEFAVVVAIADSVLGLAIGALLLIAAFQHPSGDGPLAGAAARG